MLWALLFQSAIDFDLAKVPKARTCNGRPAAGEIVVCGDPNNDARIPLLDGQDFEQGPLRAETRIGNARLSAETEQAGFNGFPSNRVMVRLKLPF